MTGLFLSVKRDGEWQAIEVEYLTPEERRSEFAHSRDHAMRWMDLLCEEITKLDVQRLNVENAELKAEIVALVETMAQRAQGAANPAAPPGAPPAEPPPSVPPGPPASPR